MAPDELIKPYFICRFTEAERAPIQADPEGSVLSQVTHRGETSLPPAPPEPPPPPSWFERWMVPATVSLLRGKVNLAFVGRSY